MTFRSFIIFIFFLLILRETYAQKDPDSSDLVKIGLLVSGDGAAEAQNGAALAIEKANKRSDGKIYKLIIRSMEGPWGTGSKEAVNLVFNEKVWAILGSHDGRNAHLVEQVIAKTHVVFLSARATDPTLYQAFVPWFFSCVPNDLQQADVLIKEIFGKRKYTKITSVSDCSYDLKQAQEFFLKKIKEERGIVQPQSFCTDTGNFRNILKKIKDNGSDCILLFEKPSASLNFIEQMRQNETDLPVFGTLALMSDDRGNDNELSQFEGLTFLYGGNWLDTEHSSFAKAYKMKYNKFPGATASFAYDCVNTIIKAIKASGYDREKVQESMSKIHYKGVTGTVEFDKNGNRKDSGKMNRITNGKPVLLENN
jgi:branched-chain amino acid transport system substrate-binding protein